MAVVELESISLITIFLARTSLASEIHPIADTERETFIMNVVVVLL